MSSRNIISFLHMVAVQADTLDRLKVRSKQEVIVAATEFGFPFSESEFNSLIWNLEVYLASKRGEQFNAQFPLWQTMWGKYYLEYLVIDMLPSFNEADFDSVITPTARTP